MGDDIQRAISMLANAKDLGWMRRGQNEYTRLLKFEAPLTNSILVLLIPALCLFDGPEGRPVMPGHHAHELTDDKLILRLRVHLPLPPAPATATTYSPTGLFGSKHGTLPA